MQAYLIADLEEESFCATLHESKCFFHQPYSPENEEYRIIGPSRRLTRFLRGCPTPTPDLRKPEDLQRELEAFTRMLDGATREEEEEEEEAREARERAQRIEAEMRAAAEEAAREEEHILEQAIARSLEVATYLTPM